MTDTILDVVLFQGEGLLAIGTENDGGSLCSEDAFHGSFCAELAGADIVFHFDDIEVGYAFSDDNYNTVGLAWKFVDFDLTPSSEAQFFSCMQGAGGSTALWRLKIDTDGDVNVYDYNENLQATITAPFENDVWYYIEVSWLQSNSGDISIKINDVLVVDAETGDFQGGLTNEGHIELFNFYTTASTDVIRVDHLYVIATDQSSAPRIWTSKWVAHGPYSNTYEDATDQGQCRPQRQPEFGFAEAFQG